MSAMFEDLTPIGSELYGYTQEIVSELINGVGEILQDRGEALEFIRKIETFGYELTASYVNRHRPPQAPKVGKPKPYIQGSFEISWNVDGWNVFLVLFSGDPDRISSCIGWESPSGEKFYFNPEKASKQEFRPVDWHYKNKPEVLLYWPEPKEEDSAIAV